jgi:hypothetical protein
MTKQRKSIDSPGQASLFSGAQLRDIGMQQALDHANATVEDWGAKAYRYVEYFAAQCTEFRAEQVRVFAEKNGLEAPPSKRSWGAVIAKAVRKELIRRVRHEPCENPKAHACTVAVWRGCE